MFTAWPTSSIDAPNVPAPRTCIKFLDYWAPCSSLSATREHQGKTELGPTGILYLLSQSPAGKTSSVIAKTSPALGRLPNLEVIGQAQPHLSIKNKLRSKYQQSSGQRVPRHAHNPKGKPYSALEATAQLSFTFLVCSILSPTQTQEKAR